ncbi:biotin synthase BioB [Phycisphaera mikurensis]|uniref:Biotin synthase n=1 Tax=Phycisphaera mikurensis (strain NBRC 102666 / KCTC 22515 / FYK2301M01) TaxID=1142394 RepID=I0IEU4_PHYMF|nr:biotin synthase BioB [Phycisphaera mikurensis]MBB6441577.1 biotin synthase [Phycisphaera mikurensis]BAM03782.1 biotin synthase [Phycisphaera mikurensis NBRC 102666]
MPCPPDLAQRSLAGETFRRSLLVSLLDDPAIDTLELVHQAYLVRRHHFGREVQVHVLNNAQNGRCPEDCSYCTQAKTSEAGIEPYAMKPAGEVLAEAQRAYEAGAHRYCMVFSGRGPSAKRTEQLAGLIREVKGRFPTLEVCVSAGLLDGPKAEVLAEAGLDRLNHNLNTSPERYGKICTTHTHQDRVDTLRAARAAGLSTCSGFIAGMGEDSGELADLCLRFRELGTDSIPVNFLLPFEGNVLEDPTGLDPLRCLRILSVVRLTNPAADVRCAAGREFHLRSLEALCLQPANSLFLDGYLNGKGAQRKRVYAMIRDAGFSIVSDASTVQELADRDVPADREPGGLSTLTVRGERAVLKQPAELRPAKAKPESERTLAV